MSLLPFKCRRYLDDGGFAYSEAEDNGHKGVILRDHQLPQGKFDAEKTHILILLPGGYPDAAPDMFYVSPWLRLLPGGQYPKNADQPFQFQGASWQRWSRHNSAWRPGVDGIWVMVKRVLLALEEAA